MLYEVYYWILINYGWFFLFICAYLTLNALGNLLPKPRLKPAQVFARFALVIPAHNEERVLGDLLKNLRALDYPQDLVDLWVICDHCTDRTQQIAEQHGAVALLRTEGPPGKGNVLDWGLSEIFRRKGKEHYDACAFFDADNRVMHNFLRVMNDHLQVGHQAMQAFLDIKNPSTNWITRTIFVEQHSSNFLWQGGKVRLHGGNYLIGTGMCIKADILAEIGWKVESAVEDLEMSLKLALRGIRIYWVEETRVYDEVPIQLRIMWHQRQRWAVGLWKCLLRYTGPCLWRGLITANGRLWDMVVYMFNPIFVLLSLFYLILNGINAIFGIIYFPPDPLMTYFGTIFGILFAFSGVLFSRIPILPNLPYILIYYSLIPIVSTAEYVVSLFRLRKKTWFHTPHSLTLDKKIKL